MILELARGDSASAAQRVDRAARDDRGQPRLDRPARLVGVADPVQGQQRLLDDVLDLLVRAAAAARDGAGERQDRLQEGAVGVRIPLLRGGEQFAPAFVVRGAAGVGQSFLL